MREDENKRSSNQEKNSLSVNVKRLMRKRWAAPALYLVVAAGILSAVFFLQGENESTNPESQTEINDSGIGLNPFDEEAMEVTISNEVLEMPVSEDSEVEIVGPFYDTNGTLEDQQKALVFYDNMYYQNKGIDYARADGESFEVTAALSGTVVKAQKDALLGYVVELNHENGIVTHYHSLEGVSVSEGETVKQGEALGNAGRNMYNTDAGVHVHFELRNDGIPVNPTDLFKQPIDTLLDEAADNKEPADGEKEQPEKEESTNDALKQPADDKEQEEKEKEDEQENSDDEDTDNTENNEAIESIGEVSMAV
ncbi:hypothetical protein BTS2_1946 [Bacillus sp. TS-2]|nr:hypothetical protein BTS2_1946 [Bacillus sp. TS-2]